MNSQDKQRLHNKVNIVYEKIYDIKVANVSAGVNDACRKALLAVRDLEITLHELAPNQKRVKVWNTKQDK